MALFQITIAGGLGGLGLGWPCVFKELGHAGGHLCKSPACRQAWTCLPVAYALYLRRRLLVSCTRDFTFFCGARGGMVRAI